MKITVLKKLNCLKKHLKKQWQHFTCEIMGWHEVKEDFIGYDGCSFTSTCSKCGKEVLLDSQGNWF